MRICVKCPTCWQINLTKDAVTLVIGTGEDPLEGRSRYMFDCTKCGDRVVKPAPRPVAAALVSVQVAVRTIPAEVLERMQGPQRPPLATDDLLDALLSLRSTDDTGRDHDLVWEASRGVKESPP